MHPFESLRAWQESHQLILKVYRATESWPTRERYALTSQAGRAAFSIAANIAEGGGEARRPGIPALPRYCARLHFRALLPPSRRSRPRPALRCRVGATRVPARSRRKASLETLRVGPPPRRNARWPLSFRLAATYRLTDLPTYRLTRPPPHRPAAAAASAAAVRTARRDRR